MKKNKAIEEALIEIFYRIYPPDGVWFSTEEQEDIKKILEELVKNVNTKRSCSW